jgi:hypothetical protein
MTIGPAERRQIEVLAAEAIARGESFEPPRYVGGDAFGALYDILVALMLSHTALEESLLPTPDRAAPLERIPFSDYSDGRLVEFVESLFLQVIESYEILARESLGRLASTLEHYRQLPLYAAATLRRSDDPNEMPGHAHHLVYAFGHAEGGTSWADVTLSTGRPSIERTDQGFKMTTGRGQITLRRFTISSLTGCMRPANDRPLAYGRGRTGAERFHAPVRAAVYELIQQDLKEVTPELLLSTVAVPT